MIRFTLILKEKDPVGIISKTSKMINHIHISENDRGTPGKGNVSWADTFKEIKNINYNGWLTIEAFGRALPDLAAATEFGEISFHQRRSI